MEGNKFFFIRKTIPGILVLELRSINNQDRKHTIILTPDQPMARVPIDMALWIFYDNDVFKALEEKAFTVDNIEELTKKAIEEGLYFEEKLSFETASADHMNNIAKTLKEGAKIKIKKLLETEDSDVIINVARENIEQLTSGIIKYLEDELQVQLLID